MVNLHSIVNWWVISFSSVMEYIEWLMKQQSCGNNFERLILVAFGIRDSLFVLNRVQEAADKIFIGA